MAKRYLLATARLFFGFLTFVALTTSLINALRLGNTPVYFFSFFTTLTNLFSAIVLLAGAIYLIRRKEPTEAGEIIRGTAVAAIAAAGLAFSVLLSRIDSGMVPWINFVVHYLTPVVMVLDWLIHPPKARLAPKHIGLWLIFPLAYLAYTIIRGAFINWYPYWFLNPSQSPGGWTGVLLISAGITLGFLVVSFALLWLGNKLSRRAAQI
jgi:hypothetical protein